MTQPLIAGVRRFSNGSNVSFQSPGKFVEDRRFDNLEEAVYRLGNKNMRRSQFSRLDSRKWNDTRNLSNRKRDESRHSRVPEDLDEI